MKLLVVCHGNICRSPLAAALLREAGFKVRQGGFRAEGRRSPPKIRRAAEALGLSLEDHRSRKITDEDADWADRIIYMDPGNHLRLLGRFPSHAKKTEALGVYAQRVRIPDPNFFKEKTADFRECMSLIAEACKGFISTHKKDV